MASNVSLIDLDDPADHPQTQNVASDSHVATYSKPMRNAKRSQLGIESQKNELAFSLYAAIKRDLKAIDAISRQCRGSDASLDMLTTCINEIESKAGAMTSDYAKLSRLSNNKVEKKVETFFEYFVGEVGSTIQRLSERKEEMLAAFDEERRANEELEEGKMKLQQEERELEEFIEERRRQQLLEIHVEEEQAIEEQQFCHTATQHSSQQESTPLHCSQGKTAPQSSADNVIMTRPFSFNACTTPSLSGASVQRTGETMNAAVNIESTTKTASDQALNTSLSQLVLNIAEELKTSRKTDIQPDVFNGNPLEFAEWASDFDTYLESMGIKDGAEQMRYLKRYLSGAAKECVSGLFLVRTKESYRQARERLQARFGNKLSLARSMRERLESWPKIAANDAKGLQKFADCVENCKASLDTLPGLSILNDPQVNERLAAPLPDWARRKWASRVYKVQKDEDRYPAFKEFASFLDEITELQSLPLLQNHRRSSDTHLREAHHHGKPAHTTKTFATSSSSRPEARCAFCTRPHATHNCLELAEKPYEQRLQFLQDHSLCFICCGHGHVSTNCRNKTKVACKKCRRPGHSTCLHKRKEDWEGYKPDQHQTTPLQRSCDATPIQEKMPSESSKASATRLTNEDANTDSQSDDDHATKLSAKNTRSMSTKRLYNMGMPVYVSSADKPEKQVLVYAFFDSASDHSYITQDLAEKLQPKWVESKPVNIETMAGETRRHKVTLYSDLVIKGYFHGEANLPSAYEWAHIPSSTGEFANNINVEEYPHLRTLADKLPPPLDAPVGLLLGANCPSAQFPLEAIRGSDNQPYALRTKLGWVVYGVEDPTTTKVQRTLLSEHHDTEEKLMSQDDFKFIDIMNSQTQITSTGTYQMPLPFKKRPTMPNNIEQARKRLGGLRKRMEKDNNLKTEYTTFMEGLIEAGHAELVADEQITNPGEVWYIPHFAVRHPQKQKLRVVFDCKATFGGTSLNDHLLQGPDMLNSLIGILCRFRRETIAISCDIQQMFYNFLVEPADRNFLRFLWYDREGQEKVYRMTVHLFGARSSPAVATHGLRKIAENNKEISKEAAAFIHRDFYVDDGLTSTNSVETAMQLIEAARSICEQGRLRLHKFSSNSAEVLASLPESERSVQDKDLFGDMLPEQRTLGLQWSMSSDSFKFVNKIQDKPTTRRGILSVVSQLYDPLGLIAPYTLIGKNILQEVNKQHCGWDDPVSEAITTQWANWIGQLPALEKVSIPRCYKPKDFGKVSRRELHHFCDASDNGIGACSYIRQVNSEGQVHVAFVMGKSKVIPSKGLFTIPRLELMSAVMATQLSCMLREELDMDIDDQYFWSDSMITLGWIANETKRFNPFVHNRIRTIMERTEIAQWYHVPGDQNPADVASRGKACDQLLESIWFTGPDFLHAKTVQLLEQKRMFQDIVDSEDPELKKVKAMITNTNQEAPIIERFQKYSTWNRLVCAVAILQSIHKDSPSTFKTRHLTADGLSKARTKIILLVQQHHFSEELGALAAGKPVSKKSPLSKLNPYIDDEGVLRIGGRVKESVVLGYEEKHPVMLPKNDHVSLLIVRHYHSSIHHQGRTFTKAALRMAGYWILDMSRLVKSVLHKCIVCAKLRGKPAQQIMADLPGVRIEPSAPFTHTGMDCFGPFVVKERRSEVKRWALLLTCLYSRAVHIEVLDDMSTDTLISALRCFICLRGKVKTIRCDRGTNFVGASNELQREASATSHQTALKKSLTNQGIEFIFNAPLASHAGGVWERQIRDVRAILNGMLKGKYKSRLNTSGLRTALYEAMATVNSRPIASSSLDDPQTAVITPSHLLTSKAATTTPPPGNFDSTEIYGRKMWRKAQQFAEEFWEAWRADYLGSITRRQRWENPSDNISKGDIVLVIDENLPRNLWSHGIVDSTKNDSDGKVRRVTIRLANSALDQQGRPTSESGTLERPIQKIILLQKGSNI